jgi:hypothetical protein
MYSCKQCGQSAEVVDGKLLKSCTCQCGVLMDMGTAHLKSFGNLKEKMTLLQQASLLINHIVVRVKKLHGETQRR